MLLRLLHAFAGSFLALFIAFAVLFLNSQLVYAKDVPGVDPSSLVVVDVSRERGSRGFFGRIYCSIAGIFSRQACGGDPFSDADATASVFDSVAKKEDDVSDDPSLGTVAVNKEDEGEYPRLAEVTYDGEGDDASSNTPQAFIVQGVTSAELNDRILNLKHELQSTSFQVSDAVSRLVLDEEVSSLRSNIGDSIAKMYEQVEKRIDAAGSSGALSSLDDLSTFDTDDLSEGSTNLYYTSARVISAITTLSDVEVGNSVTASGLNTTAFGLNSSATANGAQTFGYGNTSSAIGSITVGASNTATQQFALAVGYGNNSTSSTSLAFGYGNTSSAIASLAIGSESTASGINSIAIGTASEATASRATAIGDSSVASANFATAFGYYNNSTAQSSTASGYYNVASGLSSSAVGSRNTANQSYASAFGYQNTASGYYSTAAGYGNTASGHYSSAVGQANTASDYFANGFGYSNVASGSHSSGFGVNNTVSGDYAAAFGVNLNNATNNTVELGASNTTSVILNTTAGASVQFTGYGAGTLETNASGVVTASSDERLKDISGYSEYGLSTILQINPIEYSWKEDSGVYDGGIRYVGFSAQNVQEALPEAVSEGDSGYLSLQLRPIVAALVNAVKELDGRVDDVKDGVSDIVRSFGELVVGKISVSQLIVRDSDDRLDTGIVIYDRSTDEPVCVYIEDGVLKTQDGFCEYEPQNEVIEVGDIVGDREINGDDSLESGIAEDVEEEVLEGEEVIGEIDEEGVVVDETEENVGDGENEVEEEQSGEGEDSVASEVTPDEEIVSTEGGETIDDPTL